MEIYSILVFIIGAAIGSFVNVVVLRYNTGLSFIKGNSVCLSCGRELPWYDLLPIYSYIKLRGRCSGCYSKFSIQYLLAEIISGFALVWIFIFSNHSIPALPAGRFPSFLLSIIYFLLLAIFIYDLRHKIIPDPFVFLFIGMSLLYSLLYSNLATSYLLLATITIPLPFFIIWLVTRGRAMGLGDIKFMSGIGALLGLQVGISAIFLSFWIGALFILILYISNKVLQSRYNIGMKVELPFAPFLIVGTIIAFVFQLNLVGF